MYEEAKRRTQRGSRVLAIARKLRFQIWQLGRLETTRRLSALYLDNNLFLLQLPRLNSLSLSLLRVTLGNPSTRLVLQLARLFLLSLSLAPPLDSTLDSFSPSSNLHHLPPLSTQSSNGSRLLVVLWRRVTSTPLSLIVPAS